MNRNFTLKNNFGKEKLSAIYILFFFLQHFIVEDFLHLLLKLGGYDDIKLKTQKNSMK